MVLGFPYPFFISVVFILLFLLFTTMAHARETGLLICFLVVYIHHRILKFIGREGLVDCYIIVSTCAEAKEDRMKKETTGSIVKAFP